MFDGSPEREIERLRELVDDDSYYLDLDHMVQRTIERCVSETQAISALKFGRYVEHGPDGRVVFIAKVQRGTGFDDLKVVVVRRTRRIKKRAREMAVFISAIWVNDSKWKKSR